MYFQLTAPLRATFTYFVLAMSIAGCEQRNSTPENDSADSHHHEHQDSEPLFGGQIVEIGHTHNPDGLIFYFAEILPENDNTIRLHLSAKNENGESTIASIEEPKVVTYVTGSEEESLNSQELVFTLSEKHSDIPATLLSAEIPEDLRNRKELSLVVPKIVLGGERLSFALSIERGTSHEDSQNDTYQDSESETGIDGSENGELDEACPPASVPAETDQAAQKNQENSP